MKILSLFNGMSCGAIALDMLNIEYEYYYSEVDKYANKLTESLYPNAIGLGDVRNIDVSKLPYIDVLIGGSPCQSFSFAGKRKGMSTKCEIEILSLDQYLELKENNFEFEGQSYLFWEYIRILRDIQKYNPDVKFLLENVIMVEKWRKVISQNIGIPPIQINAALVSAQNRDRNFWTNIKAESQGLFGDMRCTIPQPKDKGILLRDILEKDVDEKYYLSESAITGILNHKKEQEEKGYGFGAVIKKESEKMNSLKIGGKGIDDLVYINREVKQINSSNESGEKQPYQQNRVYDPSGISPALCRDKSDLLICHNTMPRSGDPKKGGTGHLSRVDGKTYCLDTKQTNAIEYSYRQDTPILESANKYQCLRANAGGKTRGVGLN